MCVVCVVVRCLKQRYSDKGWGGRPRATQRKHEVRLGRSKALAIKRPSRNRASHEKGSLFGASCCVKVVSALACHGGQ